MIVSSLGDHVNMQHSGVAMVLLPQQAQQAQHFLWHHIKKHAQLRSLFGSQVSDMRHRRDQSYLAEALMQHTDWCLSVSVVHLLNDMLWLQ